MEQQQPAPVRQDPNNAALQRDILQELKSINNGLSRLDQVNEKLENVNNKLQVINRDLQTTNKKLEYIGKHSEKLDDALYGKESAGKADLYYKGIGLGKLINGLPKCETIKGDGTEEFKRFCEDLKKRAEDLNQVASVARDQNFKMALQDRVEIINKAYEVIQQGTEELRMMVLDYARDKIKEGSDKKSAEELEKLRQSKKIKSK